MTALLVSSPGTKIAVLMAMLARCPGEWVSSEALADAAGMSVAHVRRVIRRAIDRGCVQARRPSVGERAANEYLYIAGTWEMAEPREVEPLEDDGEDPFPPVRRLVPAGSAPRLRTRAIRSVFELGAAA